MVGRGLEESLGKKMRSPLVVLALGTVLCVQLVSAQSLGVNAVQDRRLEGSQEEIDPLRYSCFRNTSYCCFEDYNRSWVQTTPRCEFDEETQSFPCSVKLGVNNWLNSFANVHVAKIFIEEFLGYPVEITADYDSFERGDEQGLVPLLEMWDWLETGKIDAILEVWEIGKAEFMQTYFKERRSVVQAGSLGVIGGIGWYIPSFLMQDNSDESDIHILGCESREFLEYWRSFESEGAADLFKNPLSEIPCCLTDPTDPRQQKPCMAGADRGGTPVEHGGIHNSSECDANPTRMVPTYGGRFLEGSSTWKAWEQQIIRNLGLNFTIEYALTEREILNQVELATSGGYGLLFYFWEPHAPFTRYNLTRINLPRRSQKCVDETRIEEYDCDYPQEILFKMYRAVLRTTKPDLADFFEAFRFGSNRDQEQILSDVYYGHDSFTNAACSWVKEKPDVWDEWTTGIEKKYSNKYWPAKPPNEVVDCKCSANGTRRFYSRPQLPAYDDGQVKMVLDEDPCNNPTFSTYTHRWKTETIITNRVAQVDCEYTVPTSVKAVIIYTVSSFMVAILAVTLWLVYMNRNKSHIRASNPVTTGVFTIGALLMNLYPIIAVGEASFARCLLSFATFLFGFIWFECSLIAKAYVLYVIFTPRKRTTKRKKALLTYEPFLFFMLSTIITVLWGVFAGFTPEPMKVVIPNTGLDYPGKRCPTNTTFETVLLVLSLLLIVTSCYWAFKTWSISPAFSESKQMVVSCVNIVVFGGATIIIVKSINTLSPGDSLIIQSAAIAITTSISVGMTVWTRLYAVHAGWEFDRAQAIEQSIRQRSNTMGPKGGFDGNWKKGLTDMSAQRTSQSVRTGTAQDKPTAIEELPSLQSTPIKEETKPLSDVRTEFAGESTHRSRSSSSGVGSSSGTLRSMTETKGETEQDAHTLSIT